MKRLLGLTLVATSWISVATALAAEPERVRGTVVAVSANVLTVHTATGGNVSILLGGDTTFHGIPRGSDHGDRGDRTRARRAPLEDREMSVCSTKTRTAALSVRIVVRHVHRTGSTE